MSIKTLNKGPSLGLISFVILSYVVCSSYCESLTSINDLYSVELYEHDVDSSSLSKPYKPQHGNVILSEEERFEKHKETGDSLHKNSTHSMNHQQSLSASNSEENNGSGNNDATSANNGVDDVRSNRHGAESGGRNPAVPNISAGGGFAGAIRRVAGLVPMLASKISSKMGLTRIRRQITSENMPSSANPLILQHHLDTIENLNRYYSSFNDSTPGQRPTADEVKVHREYLLNLLEEMRHPNRGRGTVPGGNLENYSVSALPVAPGQNPIQNDLTKSQQEILSPPSDGSQFPSSNEIGTDGNSTSDNHDVQPEFISHITSTANPGISLKTQFANRVGQAPSDSADIQNVDVAQAALLLHQFQTQGNINLLPPNFLGQPSAQEPPRRYDVFYQQQQAMEKMGMNADAPKADLPRYADDFVQQPSWAFRSRPTPSLTSANIDPISGQYHPPVSSGNAVRVSVPDSYDKLAHSLPGVYISEATAQPAFYDSSYVQTISETGGGKSILPQDSSNIQNQPALAGPTSILDHFPDQSALINPQNIPDLLEGLKILAASGQNTHSLSLADIIQRLPIEFFLNSNLYSDYDSLINALRIIQQYSDFQGTANPNIVGSSASQPQNLIELTLPDSSTNTNLNQLYNQGYVQHIATAPSASRPQVVPVRGNQVANTRFTTELTTAFENLVDNITEAITTFMTDLAAAITENPALLLLGLIPFALLVFSLYQYYGVPPKKLGLMGGLSSGAYSSGGQSTYGRNYFMPRVPYEDAEVLARRILTNIETFENWAKVEFS